MLQYFTSCLLYVDHWSVSNSSKLKLESLAKYPTINYTAFGRNNMINFFGVPNIRY